MLNVVHSMMTAGRSRRRFTLADTTQGFVGSYALVSVPCGFAAACLFATCCTGALPICAVCQSVESCPLIASPDC